jgi:hypothetical protein
LKHRAEQGYEQEQGIDRGDRSRGFKGKQTEPTKVKKTRALQKVPV